MDSIATGNNDRVTGKRNIENTDFLPRENRKPILLARKNIGICNSASKDFQLIFQFWDGSV